MAAKAAQSRVVRVFMEPEAYAPRIMRSIKALAGREKGV
jgi:hypothetical protein